MGVLYWGRWCGGDCHGKSRLYVKDEKSVFRESQTSYAICDNSDHEKRTLCVFYVCPRRLHASVHLHDITALSHHHITCKRPCPTHHNSYTDSFFVSQFLSTTCFLHIPHSPPIPPFILLLRSRPISSSSSPHTSPPPQPPPSPTPPSISPPSSQTLTSSRRARSFHRRAQ